MKKALIIIGLLIILIAGAIFYIKHKVTQIAEAPFQFHLISLDSISEARLKAKTEASVGVKIDKSVQLTTSDGKEISLGDVIKEPPKLFFVFESDSCEECINREFLIIKPIKNSMKKESFIFISSFKDLKTHKKAEEKRDITIYNIGKNHIGLPVEEFRIPFLFVVDTNYTAQAVSPSIGFQLGYRPMYYGISLRPYKLLKR